MHSAFKVCVMPAELTRSKTPQLRVMLRPDDLIAGNVPIESAQLGGLHGQPQPFLADLHGPFRLFDCRNIG